MGKWSVVRDELNIRGGGLYCILPFDNTDKDNKAVYKIGKTLDFNRRFESYHTSFPQGFYIVCIIERPPIPHKLRGKKAGKRENYYRSLETQLIDHIEEKGGERIKSNARIRGSVLEESGGNTEWFYTSYEVMFKSFQEIQKINEEVTSENNFGKPKRNHREVNNFHSFNTTTINTKPYKPKYVGKIFFM